MSPVRSLVDTALNDVDTAYNMGGTIVLPETM